MVNGRACLNKTRFQLMVPVPNHNVTKNLTGHRMHIEGPEISLINRQINSFQNMYDMLQAKIDRLARKLVFVQKKTSKSPIFVCTNVGYLTLEGLLDVKPLTQGQVFGWFWVPWGITVQISYVGGRWHQN